MFLFKLKLRIQMKGSLTTLLTNVHEKNQILFSNLSYHVFIFCIQFYITMSLPPLQHLSFCQINKDIISTWCIQHDNLLLCNVFIQVRLANHLFTSTSTTWAHPSAQPIELRAWHFCLAVFHTEPSNLFAELTGRFSHLTHQHHTQ